MNEMIYIDDDTNRPFMPTFMILPSMSCPASCRYCFGPNKGKAMDLFVAQRSINYIEYIANATGQSKVHVTLHGGEPLAAKFNVLEYIIEGIVDKFSTRQLSLSIQSNLWLLSNEHCKLFKKYNVRIGTSLDGPKVLNDMQRGEGYFEKTMKGINLARKHNIDVGVIATLTSKTIDKHKEIFDFFSHEKLSFSFHLVSPTIGKESEFEVTPEKQVKLYENALEYYKEHCTEINISTINNFCKSLVNNRGAICTFKDCFGGFLVIGPDGNIYPCQRFANDTKLSLGNILDNPSCGQLLNSQAALFFLEYERNMAKKCRKCSHYNYCKGGCVYDAIANKSIELEKKCDVYNKVFTHIASELIEESASDENVEALRRFGPSNQEPKLCRYGKVIAFSRVYAPYEVYRNAKRVIAAYELAENNNDIVTTTNRLYLLKLGKSIASINVSLRYMITKLEMENHDVFNKNQKEVKFTEINSLDLLENFIFTPKKMPNLLTIHAQESLGNNIGENRQCETCKYNYICGGLLFLNKLHLIGIKYDFQRDQLQCLYPLSREFYKTAVNYFNIFTDSTNQIITN